MAGGATVRPARALSVGPPQWLAQGAGRGCATGWRLIWLVFIVFPLVNAFGARGRWSTSSS